MNRCRVNRAAFARLATIELYHFGTESAVATLGSVNASLPLDHFATK